MKSLRRADWRYVLSGMGIAGVWLVFLAYPISELLQRPGSEQAIGFSLMALFVVCYLVMLADPGNRLSLLPRGLQLGLFAAQLTVTLLTAALLGDLAMGYVPFLVSSASWGLWMPLNRILGVVVLAGATLVCVVRESWSNPGVLLAGLLILVVAWLATASMERAQREQDLALSEERNRIASDVHDLLGHSLTVVNLKLQLIDRLLDTDPDRAHHHLGETRAIVSEALANVRRTVSMERSSTLAMELAQARDALQDGNVELVVDGSPDAPTGPMALVLGWVLRESVTNVLRHAHASRVRVTVSQDRLTIEDDGDGLTGTAHDGNGLRGMRERVAAAGGELVVGHGGLGGVKVEVTW